MCVEAIEDDAGQDHANDGEQGYATVVLTEVPASFMRVEMHDGGGLEFLW